MSREPGNTVNIPIRFAGLPESLCFQTVPELLNVIQQYAFGVVPTGITNVQVGNVQPLSSERTDIWFRQDNSGKFIGIYVFDGSTWAPIYPVPGGVQWIHGDSTDLPVGFSLVDTGLAGWTAPEITAIKTMYYPTGAGPYTYFAVVFTGF